MFNEYSTQHLNEAIKRCGTEFGYRLMICTDSFIDFDYIVQDIQKALRYNNIDGLITQHYSYGDGDYRLSINANNSIVHVRCRTNFEGFPRQRYHAILYKLSESVKPCIISNVLKPLITPYLKRYLKQPTTDMLTSLLNL